MIQRYSLFGAAVGMVFALLAPTLAAERPVAGPSVVDFGGAPPDTPIAGLDQWQSGFRARGGPKGDVLGTKRIVVMRVYFHDYANTSRYSQAQVQGFFDNQLNTLWQHSSYGKISISAQVTALYQLPSNRSHYITDHGDGDTSDGSQYGNVLNDAIANSPNTIDWTNIDGVMVVMAETDPTQFHRGQGGTCDLPMGPGGSVKHVGCAIFSENPSDSDAAVYGRWSHEMGHAFQQGGPAHPSNYNSAFEQMDANYPGQTGVFEKQSTIAFPGWMPATKYVTLTPMTGGVVSVWAEEYDPTGQPNAQAIKVALSSNTYYLISVRRRVLGDELNAFFSPAGIPDEGVLIEKVVEGASQWVTVVGKGGDRNALWHNGDSFQDTASGVYVSIKQQDVDHYSVTVRFGDLSNRPDVLINPWLSPPGNTYETTDIWVDSPVNGYGTFRWGMWDDGTGNLVPVGNGDDPAIGQDNRLYVRVRNVGHGTANNVVVHVDRSNPPGLGVNGSTGWVPLNGTDANSTLDSTRFPALASMAPGTFTDVYLDWVPNFTITPAEQAQGIFYFHTCVRVRIDPVAGALPSTASTGDRQQENIDDFQAVPAGPPLTKYPIHLHNDDLVNPIWFHLNYVSELPPAWGLDVNGGNLAVLLQPDETRDIPVTITPLGPAVVGSGFGVNVSASWFKTLTSDKPMPNPLDNTHIEFAPLGGVRIVSHVLAPTSITCTATQQGGGQIYVTGKLSGIGDYYNSKNPPVVMAEGLDVDRHYLFESARNFVVQPDGTFSGFLNTDLNIFCPYEALCMFGGTDKLASCSHIDVIQNVSPPDPGDMNGDCLFTLDDVVMMLRVAGGLDVSYPGQVKAVDVDNDGRITLVDAAWWLQRLRVRRSGAVTKSTANDYFGYGVLLDDPALNGQPNARLVACHQYIGAYNGPIGVYYWATYPGGGRWVIFNEDESTMPVGEKFNYYFGEKVNQVVKSPAFSTAPWRVSLTAPSLGLNPGADPIAIHDWLAAYDNSPLSVWYNTSTNGWEAYNDNFTTIPDGEKFFFTDAYLSGSRIYHTTSNDYFNYGVYIDDARLNGNPNAIVLAQHSYQSTSNPAPMGVWYSAFAGKWVAYNEGTSHPALAMNEVVNYFIAQP